MATSIKVLVRWSKVARPLLFATNRINLTCKSPIHISVSCNKIRKSQSKIQQNPPVQRVIKYKDLTEIRKDQARRSVLIQIPSKTSANAVLQKVLTFGPVNHAFHFETLKDWLLVEFKRVTTVSSLLKSVKHFGNDNQVSIQSRLLYFINLPVNNHRREYGHNQIKPEFTSLLKDLNLHLYKNMSVSQKMLLLYEKTKLSEIEFRLRFFVSSIIEDAISGLFPRCKVIPFGSCVNGLGVNNSDLDMIISLFPEKILEDSPQGQFRFLTKKWTEEERKVNQKTLRVIGSILENFTPYCYRFQYILNARIPIVKFLHEATLIECDLSVENFHANKMSELLYMYGEIDSRFRPLMTTVKFWAGELGLTQNRPGGWVTNFTLTAMVVFFLQTRPEPILPTMKLMQSLAGPGDRCISNNIDYAFTCDISKLPALKNQESLDMESTGTGFTNQFQCYPYSHRTVFKIYQAVGILHQLIFWAFQENLLQNFFGYYRTFDFEKYGLSIIEGCVIDKPKDVTAVMYIENPLEIGHNISQNVVLLRLKELQEAFENAYTKMNERQSKTFSLESIWEKPLTESDSDLRRRGAIDVLNLFDNNSDSDLTNDKQFDETLAVDKSYNNDIDSMSDDNDVIPDHDSESLTSSEVIKNTESVESTQVSLTQKLNDEPSESGSNEDIDLTSSKM